MTTFYFTPVPAVDNYISDEWPSDIESGFIKLHLIEVHEDHDRAVYQDLLGERYLVERDGDQLVADIRED